MQIIDEKSELIIENYTEENTLEDLENSNIKYLVDFNGFGWNLNPIDINHDYKSGPNSKIFKLLDDAIVFVQDKQDEISRGKFIVSKPVFNERDNIKVDIQLSEEEIKALRRESKLRLLTLEELIKVILIENLLNFEKSKISGEFTSIIDIYDILVNPDLILTIDEKTLIISPNGKSVSLLNEEKRPTYEEVISKLI